MSSVVKRTPNSPVDAEAWRQGNFPGKPLCFKYEYCRTRPETLKTIANSLAGRESTDRKGRFPQDLNWKTLAILNYSTESPAELNWYLERFNGCKKVVGHNYVFDQADRSPFVWVPMIATEATLKVPPSSSTTVTVPPPSCEFTKAARRRFRDIDATNTGFMSRSKIHSQMLSRSFNGVDGALVGTLLQTYSDLADLSNDEFGFENSGITLADLAEFDRQWSARTWSNTVRSTMFWFEKMKAKVSSPGGVLFGPKAVDWSTICQGLVGDCWLLSVVASLQSRLDGIIRSMIQPKGDQFEVQLRDGSRPILVWKPSDPQLARLSSCGTNGLWLPILEMAIGSKSDPIDPVAGVDSFFLGVSDVFFGIAIRMLTGNACHQDKLVVTNPNTVRDKIEAALLAKKVVIAGIFNVPQWDWIKWLVGDRKGWPTAHAYSILNYNRGKDVVVIRNPWGHMPDGTPTPYGQYVPMSEFLQVFSTITIEA